MTPPDGTKSSRQAKPVGRETSKAKRRRSKPIDLAALIDKAFRKQTLVIEKGKSTRETIFGAIYKMLWTKEMAGDRQALAVRTRYDIFARNQQPELQKVFIVEGGLPDGLPCSEPNDV